MDADLLAQHGKDTPMVDKQVGRTHLWWIDGPFCTLADGKDTPADRVMVYNHLFRMREVKGVITWTQIC